VFIECAHPVIAAELRRFTGKLVARWKELGITEVRFT
jgi:hypothetical protein